MKLIQGKYNGFCFGVKSAVEAVEHALEKQKPVYILGPIIHNQAVVDRLEAKGAVTIDKVNQVPFGGTMVIRSHGVPPEVYRQCKQRNIAVIDATCPFVARIHEIVQNAEQKGIQVVIAGQKEHPEVVGINGFCQNRAWIVQDCEQAKALPEADKVLVVAQTTYVEERFEKIYQTLVEKYPEVLRENTICRATRQRQAEAAQLSEKCDAMVVIGGRHSSNTKKLAEICKNKCKNTIILESAAEFPVENLKLNGIIGIIAGASTPQWSIREVIARMNEQDLNTTVVEEQAPVEQAQAEPEATVAAQPAEPEEASAQTEKPAEEPERELTPEESFERDLEKTMVRIRPGQVKKGTVVQIVGDDVFVNIGYKADGIIPQAELSLDPKATAADIAAVGDEITVEIVKVNDGEGNVLLSRKSIERRERDRAAIAELEDGREFEVTIKQAVKAGVLAEYRGARVFIPASQLSNRYVENLEEFVGKKVTVKALEVDKSRRRIVASRRQVLQEEAIRARKEKYNQFEAGQHVKGVVRRITDFGAFTDIGGVDGLIHVTDLSWGRPKHPSDVVSVGDELELEILSVNADTERIALSLKALQPKPWDHAAERYLVGDIVEGRVDRIAPFGAFVELEPGLFGLVHISQVATRRIDKVEDELRVDDIITVKVLDVDPEAKRISLSRRAVLQPERERPQREEHHEDREPSYNLPPIEEAKVTLADFFPKMDLDV